MVTCAPSVVSRTMRPSRVMPTDICATNHPYTTNEIMYVIWMADGLAVASDTHRF